MHKKRGNPQNVNFFVDRRYNSFSCCTFLYSQ